MAAHRDNKRELKWNLEATAKILAKKFGPAAQILVVRPAKMYLGTFAQFENFVKCDKIGSPKFETTGQHTIDHLRLLLENFENRLEEETGNCQADSCSTPKEPREISLIAFSKGTVVLNQILHEISAADENLEKNREFLREIRKFFWIDGGHSGGKNTWITDPKILENFVKLAQNFFWSVEIHLSPYQISDENRPWIAKECRKFAEFLRKSGGFQFSERIHFENEERSLENHFRILENF